MNEKVEVNEKAIKDMMTGLSAGFARNAGAVADVLVRWRKPEVARAVIDSLLAGDARAFRELAGLEPDPFGPPMPEVPEFRNFCTVIFEVAQTLAPQPKVRVCRLRIVPPLSGQERTLLALMRLRCSVAVGPPVFTAETGSPVFGPVVSGPEPCLEVLRNAGIVQCQDEPAEGETFQWGPPLRVCAKP
jgi:hypothetical protein